MAKIKQQTWWVYIIETHRGSLYTGITTDLERRLRQHRGEIKGGAKFFNITAAQDILFRKKFPDRSAASRFEAQVKKLTRAQKLTLIAEGN